MKKIQNFSKGNAVTDGKAAFADWYYFGDVLNADQITPKNCLTNLVTDIRVGGKGNLKCKVEELY